MNQLTTPRKSVHTGGMEQDIYDSYIGALATRLPLEDLDLLEIGCGEGRITRDLAPRCRHVVAVDTDRRLVERAMERCSDRGVSFHVVSGGDRLPFPKGSFDVVLYSLSLHHIPREQMGQHLEMTASLLRPDGVIAVIEPADGGSYTFAKEYFGAGSGDERRQRAHALQAIRGLKGWNRSLPIPFDVTWRFDSPEEFITTLVPHWGVMTDRRQEELLFFLERHRTDGGILLDAARILVILSRDPR